jgi:hypothetical protein
MIPETETVDTPPTDDRLKQTPRVLAILRNIDRNQPDLPPADQVEFAKRILAAQGRKC